MINNIWFKIIAGKINKIPEFYTKNTRLHNKTTRLRPGQGQSFEAEAKVLASRPLWPRGLNITDKTNKTETLINWLSKVLRLHQHGIGYLGDGFTGQKTQPKHQITEGRQKYTNNTISAHIHKQEAKLSLE